MASDAAEAVIDIIGVIGWEVGYQQMREIMRSLPESVKKVVFDIYSPGGDVWEGNGIVQEVGMLGKRVDTVARVQVAASMATLIAAACNKRQIASNGRWLIHNAWTITEGDAAAHEKAAQTLRDAEAEAAKFYAERTGQSVEAMTKLMAEERWVMPEEAKALGFVQEVCDPFKPEKYEAVRQEIVAAGKWPQALVEIPPRDAKQEVNSNVSKPDRADSAPVASTEPAKPDESEVSEGTKPEDTTEYQLGYAAGQQHGRSEANAELTSKLEELSKRLAVAEKEARANQSEKDRLSSALKSLEAAARKQSEDMTKQIKELEIRLAKHVAGSLTFSPAVETWEDAMRTCGGNYAKAAEAYPELRKRYLAGTARKEK